MNLIKFKRDTSFRNELFTPDSFAHPAKMDSQLLIWIVEHFTKEGETILDPMFGSGTTMLACMLGRNVIGVELEQKFVDMANANWEKVRQKPMLGYTMGECQILQWDARNLEGLLVDKCIFSPPYCEQSDFRLHGGLKNVSNKGVIAHKFGGEENIGNLPYGQVDKIVTSPPYAEGKQFVDSQFENKMRIDTNRLGAIRKYNPKDPENLGNLPYGSIDSVITSPPHGNRLSDDVVNDGDPQRMSYRQALSKVDAVVTSPPYENKIPAQDLEFQRKRQSQGNLSSGNVLARYESQSAENNIGNLKSTSYLEAMAQVYQQCYAVLKPQGLLILITKNFIRNQKEVRLDSDTIALCEQVGFTFQERWYRELPAQSFWRVIYKKKFPNAPELKYEDVLVFVK